MAQLDGPLGTLPGALLTLFSRTHFPSIAAPVTHYLTHPGAQAECRTRDAHLPSRSRTTWPATPGSSPDLSPLPSPLPVPFS